MVQCWVPAYHFLSIEEASLPILQKEKVSPGATSMLPEVSQSEGLRVGSQAHCQGHMRSWGLMAASPCPLYPVTDSMSKLLELPN